MFDDSLGLLEPIEITIQQYCAICNARRYIPIFSIQKARVLQLEREKGGKLVRYARFSTISAQKQATHTTNTGSTVSATSVLCKYEVVALGVERKRVDVDLVWV